MRRSSRPAEAGYRPAYAALVGATRHRAGSYRGSFRVCPGSVRAASVWCAFTREPDPRAFDFDGQMRAYQETHVVLDSQRYATRAHPEAEHNRTGVRGGLDLMQGLPSNRVQRLDDRGRYWTWSSRDHETGFDARSLLEATYQPIQLSQGRRRTECHNEGRLRRVIVQLLVDPR